MLSFNLRSLDANAVRVDAELGSEDPVWIEGDIRPKGGVRVQGRLSSAGADKFYFSGQLAGVAAASCRRCLADLEVPVSSELHLLFVEDGGEGAEEPDVYVMDAGEHELDLRPALREEWLLAVPSFAVCSETCQGLCPRCGANRNDGPCGCTPQVDPRWSALAPSGGSAP